MIAVTGGLTGAMILTIICGAITGILIDRIRQQDRDQ